MMAKWVMSDPVINKVTAGMTYEERVQYYMKHPGYECLAGEPTEMTREIIRRLVAQDKTGRLG
jgi:hypothetical protein